MVHTFKQYLRKNKINDFDNEFDDFDDEFDDIFKESHMTHMIWGAGGFDDLAKMARDKKKSLNESVDKIAGAFSLDNDTKDKTTKVLKQITKGSIDFAELQVRFREKNPEELTNKDFENLGDFMKDLTPDPNKKHDIAQVLEVIEKPDNQQAFKTLLSFTQKKTKTGWLEMGKNFIKSFGSLVSTFVSWISELGTALLGWIKSNWKIAAAVGLLILIVLCRNGLTQFGLGDVCTAGSEIVSFCGRWMQSIFYANDNFVLDTDWNPFKRYYLDRLKLSTAETNLYGATGGATAGALGCTYLAGLATAATGGLGFGAIILCGAAAAAGSYGGTVVSDTAAQMLTQPALLNEALSLERSAIQLVFGTAMASMIRRMLIYVGTKTGWYDEEDVNDQLKAINQLTVFLGRTSAMKTNILKNLDRQFKNGLRRNADPRTMFSTYEGYVNKKEDDRNKRIEKKLAMLEELLEKEEKEEEREKIKKDIKLTKLGSPELDVEKMFLNVMKPWFENGRIQKAAKNEKRKQGGLNDNEIMLLLDVMGQLEGYDDSERKQLIKSNFHVQLLNDFLKKNKIAKSTKTPDVPAFRVLLKF